MFPQPMSIKIALCKSILAGPVSGADEIMVNYATHLHAAGHSVSVVLLHPPAPDDQYYRRLRSAGVEVLYVAEASAFHALLRAARDLSFSLIFLIYVPGSFERLRKMWQVLNRLATRLYVRRCRRFFARLRPDVLHVFTPDAGAALMICAGHKLNIPVLYHEMGTPHYMPALDVYYRDLAEVLPLCDEFAALSPRLAAQWSERFPFLKSVCVLPIIVDGCDRQTPPVRSAGTGETVFGYAARLEQGKGPLVLVGALDALRREGAEVIVRMAGTGPQLLEVETRVRELDLGGACEFVGFYTGSAGRSAFMRSLDVFVLPSLAEGTPNSVIEAMAHGLPVIATEVGGIPDLLSGDSGILVPPGDVAALVEAMRRLASDPDLRARMGRAAREHYLKLFSPKAVLPALLSTYMRVAKAPASRLAPTRDDVVEHPWKVAAEF
jgi:glycosyltransferase involved in cell wall biosynthesis